MTKRRQVFLGLFFSFSFGALFVFPLFCCFSFFSFCLFVAVFSLRFFPGILLASCFSCFVSHFFLCLFVFSFFFILLRPFLVFSLSSLTFLEKEDEEKNTIRESKLQCK